MAGVEDLFAAYGNWFATTHLAPLKKDELSYCLQVNQQLGDWLLHFHELDQGRPSEEPQNESITPPVANNAAHNSMLKVLVRVVDLIKTQGRDIGEVQREKGLAALYKVGTILTNEAYDRELAPTPEVNTGSAAALPALLYRAFEAVNVGATKKMLTEAELALAIDTDTLREVLGRPDAISKFDLNWDKQQFNVIMRQQAFRTATTLTLAELLQIAEDLVEAKKRKAVGSTPAAQALEAAESRRLLDELRVEQTKNQGARTARRRDDGGGSGGAGMISLAATPTSAPPPAPAAYDDTSNMLAELAAAERAAAENPTAKNPPSAMPTALAAFVP